MRALKNKVPLTAAFCKRYNIQLTDFKHHYMSLEDLLRDFYRYITIFTRRQGKTATQYCNDVRDIWRSVDPLLCMHPNQLAETKLIESKFFLPQKNRLIEKMDKDPKYQTAHIQASTIKSKLTNFNRFLTFLELRSIYIGETLI